MLRGFAQSSFGKIVVVLCLAVCGFAQSDRTLSSNASPLPSPTGMVNDYAGVIDDATKQQIEKKLRDFRANSDPPVEIAVVVVRTTGAQPIFDYSLAVARGWGIGAKQLDNPSALLLVAIDDRKYFTQISRDLEDELPDATAGSLQREYLVPEFRKGNYGKGIADTIDAYIRTIEAQNNGQARRPVTPSEGEFAGLAQSLYTAFCCFVVILVLGLIIWSNRGGKSKRDHDRWGGGGGFGGGGGALPWIIGSAIADAVTSSSSSSSDWGSSSSSSDWGSGGSDWGGFGGGGDFGGGGAGGDW